MSSTLAPRLDLIPSDEDVAIREAIAKICARYGPRYARECFERDEPTRELWRDLAEAGYVGIGVGEDHGGGGMGMRGLALVTEELAAHGVAGIMLVLSCSMAGTILERHGSDEQRARWLSGIVDGSVKLAFGITEPDAGSNSHNLRTQLVPQPDGSYRLSGQKTYISGVEDAEGVLVVARVRQPDGTLGAPSLCIVDVDAPGFTRDVIPMPYMGPDKQWTLYFDEVPIEADRLVGGEHAGLKVVFDALNPERITVAALLCGTARLAIEKAVAYANERSVWKTPIGAHQAVAHPLAQVKIELELARLMTEKAAALFDAGAPEAGEASNMAKFAAAKAATHAVDTAVQTLGGNGLALEYGVSDLWWFTRLMRIAPVSEQMILNHVAQHSLGLPRSY